MWLQSITRFRDQGVMSPKNTVRSAGVWPNGTAAISAPLPGFPSGAEMAAHEETGLVFSDIKHGCSTLRFAQPEMFHYLDDRHIPTTTNGLEGYFSLLKSHYRRHRGLSPNRRPNYFAWYFHFAPR